MVEILDKTKEWSERFGKILKASPTTRFSHLYKGAVGGLEHVISVDNAGSYMELWRSGDSDYYATTGAAIKPLPGLAKGARLDEALDRFFVLMAKKGIPKKIKRLAGVRKQGTTQISPHTALTPGGQKIYRPSPGTARFPKERDPYGVAPKKAVRKNIVEKVDPEIGPSMSVGHRRPSDLSPESSMRKLAKRIVKNVVALTGNQPGSGRVKPPKPKPKPDYKSPQGFSGRRMGTPGAPGASHGGMVRRDAMGRRTSSRRSKPDFGRMQEKLEGGRTRPGGGTTPVKPAMGGPGQPSSYGSTGQPQYRYGRKACVCDEVAKTMKAVAKPRPKPTTAPTEEERFRRGGPPSKPTQPMHPGQRMGGNLETTGGW